MRLIGVSFMLISVFGMSALATGTRKCEYTGMSAKCGDAKSIVFCEGYDQEHFMDDHEKIKNLEIILYVGEPAIDRKFESGYAFIKDPRATFRDYSISLAWYNDALLKNSPVKPESYYETAVGDIQDALKNRKPNVSLGKEDNMSMGTFEMSADSPLYIGC
jgi:hypothetical protein